MSTGLKTRLITISLLLLAAFCSGAASAHAATLSLSSVTTSVHIGDLVFVRVVVNAQGQAINTAEATLHFQSDVLNAISIDKSSSVFSIWPDEPSFSNPAGTVSFSGGIPSPGYSGSSGTVITVAFRAIASGSALLSLQGASVRANDGLGTDVLQGTNGVAIQVLEAVKVVPPPPSTTPTSAATPATIITTKPSDSDDTTPPTIQKPTFVYDASKGVLIVSATAKDSDSGINGYSIQIDHSPEIQVTAAMFADGTYKVPVHASGVHAVTLEAIDKAGNNAQVAGSFTVPTIAPPALSEVPDRLTTGDQLIVRGVASKEDVQVRISIKKGDSETATFTITPDASGTFDFIGPLVQHGTYTVWAEGISVGGIESSPTTKNDIRVLDTPVFSVGGIGVSFTMVLLLMLLLTLLSCGVAGFAWYKLSTYHHGRSRLNPKICKDIHRALTIFKDEMETHLDALESAKTKNALTEEETTMRAEMRANLVVLEKYIQNEFD